MQGRAWGAPARFPAAGTFMPLLARGKGRKGVSKSFDRFWFNTVSAVGWGEGLISLMNLPMCVMKTDLALVAFGLLSGHQFASGMEGLAWPHMVGHAAHCPPLLPPHTGACLEFSLDFAGQCAEMGSTSPYQRIA